MKFFRVLSLSLIFIIIFGSFSVNGAEKQLEWKYSFGSVQGANGFYYCYVKNNTVYELDTYESVNGGYRWYRKSAVNYPFIKSDCIQPAEDADVCIKFVAPRDGMLSLNDTVKTIMLTSDGLARGTVKLSVLKNDRELWNGEISGANISRSYDLLAKVQTGDCIYYRVNAAGSPSNDLTSWSPIVKYLTQYEYSAKMWNKTQGVDCFYYSGFGSADYIDLEYDAERKRWKHSYSEYPIVKSDLMLPSDNEGVGYRFEAPVRGMVKVEGSVKITSENGNVIAKISKGEKELWSLKLKSPTLVGEYSLEPFAVEKGDMIFFKVYANGSNANDFTAWEPTVVYTDDTYVSEMENLEYFQRASDGTMSKLTDSINGVYYTTDKKGYISSEKVQPSDNYSLVKRYTAVGEEPGRIRVLGTVSGHTADKEVIVRKNNAEVWRQLFPANEKGTVDVRIFTQPEENIDVEIKGSGEAEWKCSIDEFFGTLFCTADTSRGRNITCNSSSYLSEILSKESTNVYSLKYNRKFPMTYNKTDGTWKNSIDDELGAVSGHLVYPGESSDTVAEIKLSDAGRISIDGTMKVMDMCDGVLSNVYINNKLIWSSRTGGARAVRWDEPYDVSYFLNDICVVADVKAGDVLKFAFNKWRKSKGDMVDISNVKISYISGNPLSKTTVYKLNHSTVIDLNNNETVQNGVVSASDVLTNEYETVIYMEKSKLDLLLPQGYKTGEVLSQNGKSYINIKTAAESVGYSLISPVGGLAVLYDGIPVRFGFAEISEIKTAYQNNEFYSGMGISE